jgi:hypothetical protein
LFPFVASSGALGWNYDWYIWNNSLGAFTITAIGGSGVTLVGTGTVAQNFVRHFKVVLNSCQTISPQGTALVPAVQLISLETAAF